MGKPPFSIGKIPPTPELVNQFFNDSTGEGDEGEIDARGPGMRAATGNSSSSPALHVLKPAQWRGQESRQKARLSTPRPFEELLIGRSCGTSFTLRSSSKLLPKMAKAARCERLRELLEIHLGETEKQVERLERMLFTAREGARKALQRNGGSRRRRRGSHEGGEKKDDAPADLALIGAAQRVEHYEISGYTTARNLAQQLSHCDVVASLN